MYSIRCFPMGWVMLFVFFNSQAHGQSIDSLTAFLQKHRFNGVISSSGACRMVFDVPQNLKCYEARHHYLWYNSHLVTQLDGTGYLIEYNENKGFNRIDNTCYEGYNFGAFNFVYKDTIFSMGGYGFWHFNGMVRYFDPKNSDWVVIPTNNIVPVRQWFQTQLYFDPENSKVYALFVQPAAHELIGSTSIDKNLYVQCFDLLTKSWWDKPKKFNSSLLPIVDWNFSTGYFHTTKGRILRIENEFYLLDFKNEKLSKVKPYKKMEIQHFVDVKQNNLLFSLTNKLYFFNPDSYKTDSIVLGENDFTPIQGSFYLSEPTFPLDKNWFFGGVFLILLVIGYQVKRKGLVWKRKKKDPVTMEKNSSLLTVEVEPLAISKPKMSFKETLSETEKALLDLLVNHALQDKMTTAVQMNQVLGISKKPVKIQNNIRASTIMMINKKFQVYSGLSDELIIKERTEFDKRIFEFTVEKKYLLKVK